MKRVCPTCERPAPARLKPGRGFVCKCFVPNAHCRRERRKRGEPKPVEEKRERR